MQQVTSSDGATIAYDMSGRGEPLVLIDGALCLRSFGPMPKLAALLAPHFSLITYFVGDLSDTEKILFGLDLIPKGQSQG